MSIKYIHILLVVLLLTAMGGCSSECLDNQNSIGLAGFYSYKTKAAIAIDSLTVFGVGAPGDSMILKNAKGVKQVYLPMRINTSSVQFVLHYDQKAISSPLLNDTITLNYEPIKYFTSAECGAMYQYKILDFPYTRHIIDSVAIPSMYINNIDKENIQIFMKTSTKTAGN